MHPNTSGFFSCFLTEQVLKMPWQTLLGLCYGSSTKDYAAGGIIGTACDCGENQLFSAFGKGFGVWQNVVRGRTSSLGQIIKILMKTLMLFLFKHLELRHLPMLHNWYFTRAKAFSDSNSLESLGSLTLRALKHWWPNVSVKQWPQCQQPSGPLSCRLLPVSPLASSPYFGRTVCGEVRCLSLYSLAIELLELIWSFPGGWGRREPFQSVGSVLIFDPFEMNYGEEAVCYQRN